MSARAKWMTVGTIGWIVGMAFTGIASAQAPPALLPEPESVRIDKNRFISFSFPDAPEGTQWAVRVTLVKLYNTDPADTENEACPPRGADLPELSAFETRIRWIGQPDTLADSAIGTFRFLGSPLECCPEFRNWNLELDVLWNQGCAHSTPTGWCIFEHSPCLEVADCPVEPVLHVFGAEVVPCSQYLVQLVDDSCPDLEDESCYSDPLTLHTAKWGDVTLPMGGRWQPNFTDIGYVVGSFKAGLDKRYVQARLRENIPPVTRLINFVDIGKAVIGFKSIPYTELGPSSCPTCE